MITKKDEPNGFCIDADSEKNLPATMIAPKVDLKVLVQRLRVEIAASKQQTKTRTKTSKPSLQTVLATGLATLNLYPSRSANDYLKKANFSASIAGALAKDWHKVGKDLKQASQKYFANK